jgi:radical SAM superfamily enzyme YgiQ (UPF0313 family)
MINDIFGKHEVRCWSIETVIAWIDILVNTFNVKNIRFDDELFMLNPKRVDQFCNAVIERGWNDLNIWVYARINTIKESLLEKMARAGITWICFGIESGNEQVRKDVNKSIKVDIEKVVRLVQAHGINVLGNYIFGLPEDTFGTMQQTLDLAKELNCEFSNFYCLMAYPGSKLFKITKEQDLPASWEGFSQHGYETTPLPTKHLSSKDVLFFRDTAFNEYFSDEKYLTMIEGKFGPVVKNYITNMLKIKLKRRHLE